MRNTILLSVALLFSFTLHAQFEKGNPYIGTTFGKRLREYNTNVFRPQFSIGLSAHSRLGVFGDFSYYGQKANPWFDGYTEKRGGGIQFEYSRYFGKSKKWGWYISAQAGLYGIRQYQKPTTGGIIWDKYTQGEFSLSPGIFFKPSKRVMLFANLSGFTITSDQYNHFRPSFDMGQQINVGIMITLGKIK